MVTLELGDIPASLRHLSEALRLYKISRDFLGEADTLQLRVGLKMEIDAIDELCTSDIQKSIKIYKSLDDASGEAWCLKLSSELILMDVIHRKGEHKGTRRCSPANTETQKGS
eukprot:TRINITY_DN16894_c0_g1_i1.p2 TRINITY_DN16894_c0_g1~~TRINITY_DN16894_c0_g1_i1.p2  ORF type:complete len:113 (-),score=17.60 TRINITY_DN16894_c0_g1_i1:268-606(-)